MTANPFAALGLPARPDLGDEQVRAAWRQIAAATHPDRADGGDLARYTAASAAYAELRTPWGRSEAYADLADAGDPAGPADLGRLGGRADAGGEPDAGGEAVTAPLPAVPAVEPAPGRPWQPLLDLAQVPSRIRGGRPRRLLIRAAVAALLSLALLQLIPGTAAAPADITGLILWFVLTGRKDLAPPPER